VIEAARVSCLVDRLWLQLWLSDSHGGLSCILGCKTAKRLPVEPLGGYPPVILVDQSFERRWRLIVLFAAMLEELINQYNWWVSTKRLHMKTLGSFAAQDAAQATLAITERKLKLNNSSKCVCGLFHDVFRCFTLNQKAGGRPEGYRPSQKSLRSCLDTFKDLELLKKGKKLYKNNNIQWTFDIPKATAEVEIWSERHTRSNSPGQGRRPNADRIDDAESNRDYYANTAFPMSQITAPRGDSLLDRWIVDPGSNIHICNLTYFN
jgi:hypothetical protein